MTELCGKFQRPRKACKSTALFGVEKKVTKRREGRTERQGGIISKEGSKTDEALMLLYQQGEYEAFEELYYRHSGRVYGYIKKHISEASAAEDLVQMAFMRLHESRLRYNTEFPFLPWLFTIVRNLQIDHLRKKKAIPTANEKLDQLPGDTSENEFTEADDLNEILATLSKPERELIALRFQEGLSFEEISARLAVSSVSVRKRVSRTLGRARDILRGRRQRKDIA